MDTQREDDVKKHREDRHQQDREKGLEQILPSGPQKEPTLLTAWSHTSQTVRNKFLLWKPPSPWYFVTAALANRDKLKNDLAQWLNTGTNKPVTTDA